MSGSDGLSGLSVRQKTFTKENVRHIDDNGEAHGLLDRSHRKKPGRKPSPRTYQMHPKLMPKVGEAITLEAEALGLTQGQFIERMWQVYLGSAKRNDDRNGA